MVWVEEGAKHVVLVFSREGGRVISRALMKLHELRSRDPKVSSRFVIHVVSPLGRVEYMELLRTLIQNNIVYTLSVRYHGEDLGSLEDLARKLGDEAVYIVDSHLPEYISILREHGLNPVVV
ncbi:hypothetical protein CF15_07690 [Pyrodictium occultum]|uniref:Uncharacterized protein n=1 Tax=Pyrodictium occultum TaxID=2309 RepID=A0A0V8RWZ9_PYROC|nr:hypothetical protein [Pyrodictium occultum]KSW12588.1 hypothetical protein CF15_07690 [Pyrodictium occultum]